MIEKIKAWIMRHWRSADSDDSQGFSGIDGDRRVRLSGYLTVFVLFGGFSLWATLSPLESAAIAAGKVQVEGNSQDVQHKEGGIISQILVSNGELVNVGQALLRLDATQMRAEQQILEGRLWATRASFDRLVSERDDAPKIEFSPTLLADHSGRAALFMDSERELFEVRRRERLGEIQLLNRKEDALNEQEEGLRALLQSNASLLSSLQEEISDLEQLLAEGYVDKQRIRELQRTLAEKFGRIDLRHQSLTCRLLR